MQPDAGFPLHVRVRRRPEFVRAYAEGRRARGRFMTLFVLPNVLGYPRLGVSAPKKVGRATERNRLKRLTREVFRRHKRSFALEPEPGIDVIAVPRREMLDAPFASLEADYRDTLRGRFTGASGRPRRRRAGNGGPQGV